MKIVSGAASADRRFGRTVIALVIAGFLGVMAAGGAATLVMLRSQAQTRMVNHTFEVERHVSGIRLALEEMRSARRGLLLGLQQDSGASYAEAKARFRREVAAVQRLTTDNPRQQETIAELRGRAEELDRLFTASFDREALRAPAEEQARQAAAQAVETIADRMLTVERALLAERESDQQASIRTFYLVLGATGVLLVFVGSASILVILGYTRDLTATRDALRDLNAHLEDAVAERTRDLQRANEEIQRFAYIVSHDLRSPLVNVMGFTAELEEAARPLKKLIDAVEREAPQIASADAAMAVRQDLPEALGFIRT
jgi:CHASE3 domain sensor protein